MRGLGLEVSTHTRVSFNTGEQVTPFLHSSRTSLDRFEW
jgi:hypothetical protein